MAKSQMDSENYEKAIELLEKTLSYPHNLGEGKLYGAQENLQYYMLGLAYEKSGNAEKAKECFEKASTGLSEPKNAMYYNDQPPETIFCQGMALLKLGDKEQANVRFDNLINYCNAHINDDMKIDYFAVSLPDFLVLDADLNKQNKIHCTFMKALGSMGKNNVSQAKESFDLIMKEEPSHFRASYYYNLFAENM